MSHRSRIAKWFRGIWPSTGSRQRVLSEYASLKDKTYLLADISMRGGLHTTAFVAGDRDATLRNIGRQDLAREITELVKADPEKLRRIIETQPKD